MLWNLFLLLIGLGLLCGGAELLVRGSVSLARRLGLTPMVIGLTVVAFGTSAPELAVSARAAVQGLGNIAAANIIGSNLFNIAVILGLSAMISPLDIRLPTLKIDVPILIALTVLVGGFLLRTHISRTEGLLFIGLLILYTCFNFFMARKQAPEGCRTEFEQGVPQTFRSTWIEYAAIGGGLGMLSFGAQLFTKASIVLARNIGLSETLIGLTIIAAGTSLPELATSVTAALKRQPDLSVGNIIGSNIINLLGILGTSAALAPLKLPGIGRFDIAALVVCTVLLFPLLWTGRKLQRWEGALLLGGYLLYLWLRRSIP